MNGTLDKEIAEEKVFELDNEFILRLPPSCAESLRTNIRAEVKHLKNRLQIEIEPNMRRGVVKFDHFTLKAKVYDLPTVIESHKTLDRKVFYKAGDVGHIMVCKSENSESSDDQDDGPGKLDKSGRDKRYLFPHGMTLPLKNVRKHRFRKTMRNKYTESPSVEKEVKMLLKTDAEAISSRFEILNAEDEKTNEKSDSIGVDNQEMSENKKPELGEYDIFGEVSSSSEDSENEIDVIGINDTLSEIQVPETLMDIKEEETDSDIEVQEMQSREQEETISEQESKAAELNLGHILEKENSMGARAQSYERLQKLRQEIYNIRTEKRALEENLSHIENLALKERLQADVDNLNIREQQKQGEYDEIVTFLQQF